MIPHDIHRVGPSQGQPGLYPLLNPFPRGVHTEKVEEWSRNRKVQTISMVDGYCPSSPEPLVFDDVIAENCCMFHKKDDIFIAAHSDKPYRTPAQRFLTVTGPEAIKHKRAFQVRT